MKICLDNIKLDSSDSNSLVKTLNENYINKYSDSDKLKTFVEFSNISKENTFKVLKDFQENIDSFISPFEPYKELREEKTNSIVCALIYKYQSLLKNWNIPINKAIQFFIALYYAAHKYKNSLCVIPDRFIGERCDLSRKQMNKLLKLAVKLNLVIIKKSHKDIYFKLEKVFRKDSYFEKCNQFYWFINDRVWVTTGNTSSGVKFHHYAASTVDRYMKQDIVGITLAWKELVNEQTILNLLNPANNRIDLIYAEVPASIIAYCKNISIKKVERYLSELCKNHSWIKKHNKVYVDAVDVQEDGYKMIYNHYINPDYKSFEMKSFDTIKLEENHPPITQNSVIFFREPLEASKYYKHYLKHKQEYLNWVEEAIIATTLKDSTIFEEDEDEDEISDDEYLHKLTNKNIMNSSIETKSIIEIFNDDENSIKNISIENIISANRKKKDIQCKSYIIKNIEVLRKYSPVKLANMLRKTCRAAIMGNRKGLERHVSQAKTIIKYIIDIIYEMSINEETISKARYFADKVNNILTQVDAADGFHLYNIHFKFKSDEINEYLQNVPVI